MSPEIVVALIAAAGVALGALAGLAGAWLRERRERKGQSETARQADLAARFDDASELAQYIDKRVEEKVAPIRAELERVKRESHEVQDAFRTWVSAVWLWHQRGRVGELPMPPEQILSRLGLSHFVNEWPTEPKT